METSDYLRILGDWDKDYKQAILDKMFRFYFADPLSFVVTNTIAKQQFINKPVYYEEICRLTNHKFGSRSTIQLLLNEGVAIKVYHKTNHNTDKRLRVYNIHNNFMPKLKKLLINIDKRR